MSRFRRALCWLALSSRAWAASPFINELHYDNASVDVDEGVEIAGLAGADLADYQVLFYSGNDGLPYASLALHGLIPDEGSGFGAIFFAMPGIQNGPAEAVALYQRSTGELLEFLSYEGAVVATGDVADGETAKEMAVTETANTPVGQSLQRTGQGSISTDFRWRTPTVATPGRLNFGQGLQPAKPRLVLAASRVGQRLLFSLRVKPPVDRTVAVTLRAEPAERLRLPAEILLPPSGVAFEAVDSGDEHAAIVVAAEDRAGEFGRSETRVWALAGQRLPALAGWLRVASHNLRFGVGARGTASYLALQRMLARVNADIWAFQEVSGRDDFAVLKALLADMGFATDRAHIATVGDVFLGQAAENGAFASDQFLVVASRHPILRAEQIGREEKDRREMTRYPLLAEIAVPGWERPLALATVHLKAGGQMADQFRRAVEATRLTQAMRGLVGSHEIVLLGDFNDDSLAFAQPDDFPTVLAPGHRFADGSFLPPTYGLGSDLRVLGSLPYRPFPDSNFEALGVEPNESRQADGLVRRTFSGFGDTRLDYVLASDRLLVRGEIYQPAIDAGFDGLPKRGPPLPADLQSGSDHYPVFADLAPRVGPHLSIRLAKTELQEGEALEGTVTAEGLRAPVAVTLTSSRPSLAIESPAIVLDPNSPSALFRFRAKSDPRVEPDQAATISVLAEGFRPAAASAILRNCQPSGVVLFTEILTPQTGPRGMELTHLGSTDLDFARTPLAVYRYASGTGQRILERTVAQGRWPAGAVLVLGNEAMRHELLARGQLSPTATVIDRHAYVHDDSEVVFVACDGGATRWEVLEAQIGFTRADVFGQFGQPLPLGIAWERLPLALSGEDGRRRVADAFAPLEPGLDGFGLAPNFSQPYRAWRAALGANATDSDQDGWTDFAEFAFGTDSRQPSVASDFLSVSIVSEEWLVRHQARSDEPRLRYRLVHSVDLKAWLPVGQTAERIAASAGYENFLYRLPRTGVRGFLRVEVFAP